LDLKKQSKKQQQTTTTGEWTGMVEIETKKTFLEVDEACLAIF